MFSNNLAKQLKKKKVDFVRCWFQWNLFQPRILPGRTQVYHFPLDDFVSIMRSHEIDVRADDPNALTMINLEADTSRPFSKNYTKYCDVPELDFYPNYARASPILVHQFKKASEVKRLCEKPVMITETGYPSGPALLGFTKEKQAEYVRSACESAYSSDSVSAFGIWRLSDSYWLSFPYQENNFGLLDR